MASFGHAFLDGQVAIVTGAAQGNGYAIAERLVAHGCSVAAIDINAAGIEAAAERLGTLVTPFVADCADVASIRRVIGEMMRRSAVSISSSTMPASSASLLSPT